MTDETDHLREIVSYASGIGAGTLQRLEGAGLSTLATILANLRDNLAAADAGARLAVLDTWRPIESAPKDGTEVLLWTMIVDVDMGPWRLAGRCTNHKHWWTTVGSIALEPSHWMPLPEPPDACAADYRKERQL